jgi:hypothetical protein
VKLFRGPTLAVVNDPTYADKGNYAVVFVMEPELGDIQRSDFFVPVNATAAETITLIARHMKNLKKGLEGEEFNAS